MSDKYRYLLHEIITYYTALLSPMSVLRAGVVKGTDICSVDLFKLIIVFLDIIFISIYLAILGISAGGKYYLHPGGR